jgi:hypothetical protein
MEAKQPISYCIHISWFLNIGLIKHHILNNGQTIEELIAEDEDYSIQVNNSQTNEELNFEEMYEPGEGYSLRICRYPMDADEEWINGMGQKPPEELEYRNVVLFVYEK